MMYKLLISVSLILVAFFQNPIISLSLGLILGFFIKDNLKGFMPSHEGLALTKWAEEFSCHGPALEIGTFGAKSSLYIAAGSSIHNQLVYTICLLYTSPSPRDRG